MSFFFFFNDTATTEIYTLSLHDALPIYLRTDLRGRPSPRRGAGRIVSAFQRGLASQPDQGGWPRWRRHPRTSDRKSTRLNSSHANISYAVFCLKKKK